MAKDNFKALLAWGAVCIIWGTTYLAIRIGVEDMPPMLFAGIRWVIAGGLFLVFLRMRGKQLPDLTEILHLSVVGIALLGFGNGFVVVAEQWIPSGLAALLITTVPLWIVTFESILPQGPKLNGKILAGLILGLAGVVIIFGNDLEGVFEPSYLLGLGSLLLAVVSWSFGSVYSKYKKVTVHPLMAAAVQMLLAGGLQVMLGLILGELPKFHMEGDAMWALIYLTAVGSVFGYGSYIYAIDKLPLSFVSTYAYINPVIALFLGWLVLNEELNWILGIAAAIILIGVWIVRSGSIRKA